jgi:nucleoid-associated protein EbfC
MVNMNNIMKQAQAMQKKMAEMQEDLSNRFFVGESGAGAVKIEINGKYEVQSVKIDPKKAFDSPTSQDVTILEDLIMAAMNDAKQKLEDYSQGGISSMLSGMQLPTGL